ncbi:CTP synthase [Planctomycetales bacterium]|nr:CTP synthase [Planctomycetales bacterium]
MTKYIFITGGVVSSLGKGSTSASIGMLLERRGLTVRLQKLDPYINLYRNLLSPAQQGEIYVLDDGTAADIDLGHYERFTNARLNKNSSWTTGQIYQHVFEKERIGSYNGTAVQVIPHITDEIKCCLSLQAGPAVDVVITEIGGTVGDIESLPHLEAIRQFSLEAGKENVLYIHLTLIPFLKAAKEIKTKPTQHSVGLLRQIGIQPDILICRTSVSISKEERTKIGLFCNVDAKSVIEEKDKEFSIYEIPLCLAENKLDRLIIKKLNIENVKPLVLEDWYELIDRIRKPEHTLNVAVVGEYAEHPGAYNSTLEALEHAGIAERTQIHITRIPSETVLQEDVQKTLLKQDAVILSGGPGESEIEGKIKTVQIARENGIPFLGINLGMHCAVIEFARNVLLLNDAHSAEYEPRTKQPVICRSEKLSEKGLKTGTDTVVLTANSPASPRGEQQTKIQFAYGGQPLVFERFRHQFEFNEQYSELFEAGNIVLSANSADGISVYGVELPEHPWFAAVQFHPEFKSKPVKPHPLFTALIAAALRLCSEKSSSSDTKTKYCS